MENSLFDKARYERAIVRCLRNALDETLDAHDRKWWLERVGLWRRQYDEFLKRNTTHE